MKHQMTALKVLRDKIIAPKPSFPSASCSVTPENADDNGSGCFLQESDQVEVDVSHNINGEKNVVDSDSVSEMDSSSNA
jgi:hypothetical protein